MGGYGKDGEVKVNVKRRRWMWKLDLAWGYFGLFPFVCFLMCSLVIKLNYMAFK